jgi:hypothetical protein
VRKPVITAGETVMGTWCATCQLPTRVRVPLHDGSPGGPLLAVLELCPGCGANHATPMITVTPSLRRRLSFRHPAASIATAVARRDCEARGLTPAGCAYGDCPMPGSWDCTWRLREDEGTTTYLFCKTAHRTGWLEETGLG